MEDIITVFSWQAVMCTTSTLWFFLTDYTCTLPTLPDTQTQLSVCSVTMLNNGPFSVHVFLRVHICDPLDIGLVLLVLM